MPVTHYIWDELSDNVLQETDETGTTTVEYTCKPNVFGSVLSQRRDGHTYTYNYDALGATRQLTDESETVTDTYDYDAWGNELASTGMTENPYRYCGQHGYYTDIGSEELHVRARAYLPAIARWTSCDPIGYDSFVYAELSPTDLVDPSGLLSILRVPASKDSLKPKCGAAGRIAWKFLLDTKYKPKAGLPRKGALRRVVRPKG